MRRNGTGLNALRHCQHTTSARSIAGKLLKLPSRTVYFFFLAAFLAAFFAGFFFAVAMVDLQVELRPLMRPLLNVGAWRALDQRSCRRQPTTGVRVGVSQRRLGPRSGATIEPGA